MSEKVSVIVATYRREDALKNALASLAAQTYGCIEIILVDDNGDPAWNSRVAAAAAAFQQEYPHIPLKHIVNPSNQGSARTRNIGIEAAEGQYITFLDDDDIYLPEKIKNQVQFMKSGGFDYSVTDLKLYNEKGRLIDKRIRSYIKSTASEDIWKYHLKYHVTGTDTMMFTCQYIRQIGGFGTIDVGDEFYLMQRAIAGNGKFGYLPGCDLKAYVHTGEGGLSSGDAKINGEQAIYQFKKQFFKDIDAETRRYIRMRHYAVIAFAELRRKKALPFLCNAFKSFCCAPIACIKLLVFGR